VNYNAVILIKVTAGKLMVNNDQTDSLMTVREVAQLLHIHNNTVRRWSDRGIIQSYRINQRGDRRFKREDINNFLNNYNFNDLPN
jgi:excisionase family DNA binding protein